MSNIHKMIRIVSLALILSAGLIHFTYQNAYACDDRSYGGHWNEGQEECIDTEMVDCYVCIAKPIEQQ